MSYEWIGWLSSAILIATLAKQLRKQWLARTSEGVSKWLFAGQVAAEIGFLVYSVLVENWIFAVTNGLLLVENFVGLAITLKFKKEALAKPA